MSRPIVLPALALLALLSLAASAVLLAGRFGSPQAAAHLAFALGVMPLILAAIGYFVPVLTRGVAAGRVLSLAPLLAATGAALAVPTFMSDHDSLRLAGAAALAALACTGTLAWVLQRTRRMLGPRHRGIDWYAAALGMLLLALTAVMLMPALPEWREGLRRFHIHANLLGFVGLTATGTLQVLLPTCVGRGDPGLPLRLRRDAGWATSGALLISVGAAWPHGLPGSAVAFVGTLCFLRVLASLLRDWWRAYGRLMFHIHGPTASLVAASIAFVALLGIGVAHAAGLLGARPAIAGFVVAFLLPLVSGAAAQLLPVWLRPGAQGDWHHGLRRRLGRWAGARGWIFVLLGAWLTLAGHY